MFFKLIVTNLDLISVVFSIAVSVGSTAVVQKQCDSLNANKQPVPGKCVGFPSCPRLLDFAKHRNKNLDDFRYLSNLTCGFQKDKPRICCPLEDIYEPPIKGDHELSGLKFLFPAEENEAFQTSKQQSKPNPTAETSNELNYSIQISGNSQWEGFIPKLEDCGEPRLPPSIGDRIIGGTKTQPGEFPYLALLYRIDTETDEEEYYCSGTIINQFTILTAGHCIRTNENSAHKLAFIQVGITNVLERCHRNNQSECINERRHEVRETIVHPKYMYGSKDRSHDIALIRTVVPMDITTKFVRPVCLPFTKIYGISLSPLDKQMEEKNNTGWGIVAGWGRESNLEQRKTATTLKSLNLPILSKSDCQQRYSGQQLKISDTQICAGGVSNKDTCVGDSGGPLLTPFEPERGELEKHKGKMFQSGIISFGPALCAVTGKPSVYTNVFSYVDWILENIKP